MPILDTQALFSDAQAITATAFSTNVYDKIAARTFFGRGRPMQLLVVVTTLFTSAGATTMTVELVHADDAALTVNVTSAWITTPYAKVGTWDTAGTIIPVPMVPFNDTRRYVGLRYTVATGPWTAGNLTAGIMLPGFQTRLTGAWL